MGGGAEGGEGGVIEGEIAANDHVVAPTQAGEHGLAVGGLGHLHGPLPELVMCKTPPRNVGRRAGRARARRGRLQSSHRLFVEGEVATNDVVPIPAHLGKHRLTIGRFGDVDGLAAELVVLKAPLRHALLPAILSRSRTHSHQRGRQQHPSTEHHGDPGNTTGFHSPTFYHTHVLAICWGIGD